jgi:hypothetical protein
MRADRESRRRRWGFGGGRWVYNLSEIESVGRESLFLLLFFQ